MGMTSAAVAPRSGQTAPKMQAQVWRVSRGARAGAAPGPDAGEGALLADPRVRHGPWTGGGTMANSWNHTSKGLSRA